jgi:hypothetical protein
MIEKTLSTFHPGNIVLQQQYRNSKYQKYSELSEVLSVAEQQNKVHEQPFYPAHWFYGCA